MARRRLDRESQARIDRTAQFAIFFLCVFVVTSSFGAISGSRSLLTYSVLSVFGALAAMAALWKVTRALRSNGGVDDSSRDKTEVIVVTFASLGIVAGTAALFLSSLHLLFSRTLFPPSMSAAWTAALVAAAIWGVAWRSGLKMDAPQRRELEAVFTLLDAGFVVSILIVMVVLLSRMGFTALDGVFAVLEATVLMSAGLFFLHRSLTRHGKNG